MPAYNNTPFKPNIEVIEAGWPSYLVGGYNFDVAWGNAWVLGGSITSDVATITVQILAGNIPSAGDLLSTQGLNGIVDGIITAAVPTAGGAGTGFAVGDTLAVTGGGGSGAILTVATETSGVPATYTVTAGGSGYTTGTDNALTVIMSATGVAGEADITAANSTSFEVSDAVITAVSINANTGIGTISYALTSVTVPEVTLSGRAAILPAESAETISADYTSVPVTIPFQDTENSKSRTVTVLVKTPTNDSFSATYSLEGAMNDIDSEYTPIPGVFYTGNSNISTTNSVLTATIAAPAAAGGSSSAEFPAFLYRFLRLAFTVASGSATVVAKIMA